MSSEQLPLAPTQEKIIPPTKIEKEDEKQFHFDDSLIAEAMMLAKESPSVQKEGFKQNVFWALRKTMLLVTAYASINLVTEVGKRAYAYDKYEDLKEILAKYKSESLPKEQQRVASYAEKYNKAVELFGAENLDFLPKHLQSDAMDDVKYIEESINRHEKRLTDIGDAFEMTMSTAMLPRYFFTNTHIWLAEFNKRRLDELQHTYTPEHQVSSQDIAITGENNAAVVFNEGASNIDDTLHNESFNRLLKETYPKGWFSGEVDEIFLTNKKIFTTGEWHLKSYGEQFEEGGHFEPSNERIVLPDVYNKLKNDKAWFFNLLGHEGSHANDWQSNDHLNAEERLDLLLSVCDRIDDDDRFISSYVEGINPSDIHQKNLTRSTEYWAEICAEYFTHGPKNLSPKDVSIIESIIKKKDPYFDIGKALEKRRSIINNEVHADPVHQELREIKSELKVLFDRSSDQNKSFWSIHKDNVEHVDEICRELHIDFWDDIVRDTLKIQSSITEDDILKTLIELREQCNQTKREILQLTKKYQLLSQNKKANAFDIMYSNDDF